jgi:hypothetical protein
MRAATWATAVAATCLITLLTSCSTTGDGDPADVTGIPEAWLTATQEGWPSSRGYGGDVPVLSRGECLLGDETPDLLGGGAEHTDSGWGGYGDDPDGYRYVCSIWKRDVYSGDLQLLRAVSPTDAEQTVEEFRSQPSTGVQDNTVEEVTSGDLDLLVLTRWYPTNPQGLYQAIYHDEQADAIVSLEINSLSEEDFAALTPQDVADALVAAMASSS